MTSIGNCAFYDCTALKSVIVKRAETLTALGESAFENTADTMTIYVPAAEVEDYRNAENWSAYADRIVGFSDTQLKDGQYTDYTFTSHCHYTGVISNGVTYTPVSESDKMFVVTVTSGSDISADLTCKLDFE